MQKLENMHFESGIKLFGLMTRTYCTPAHCSKLGLSVERNGSFAFTPTSSSHWARRCTNRVVPVAARSRYAHFMVRPMCVYVYSQWKVLLEGDSISGEFEHSRIQQLPRNLDHVLH